MQETSLKTSDNEKKELIELIKLIKSLSKSDKDVIKGVIIGIKMKN